MSSKAMSLKARIKKQLGNGLVYLSEKLPVNHMDIDKRVIYTTLLCVL